MASAVRSRRGSHGRDPLPRRRRSPLKGGLTGSSENSEPQARAFRADVEGLRAVAILLVVLYHTHAGISGGYVGVDVFFVISGFLITRQLVRELMATGKISFMAFYARRARRILPAAALTTIVTTIAAALLLPPLSAIQVFSDARAAALFGANVHFAAQGADYFNDSLPPSPVQHYWSLSVEEQFYVVWPLLLVVSSMVWLGVRRRPNAARRDARSRQLGGSLSVSRPRIRVVALVLGAVAAVSFLASVAQTPASPSWAYYSIFTRAWELAAGALVAISLPLAQRLDNRLAVPLTWVGVACIALAALTFTDATTYPGAAALLPVAGAVAIIAAGCPAVHRRGAEALLGTAPFQRVGAWSYSWYLWHWPVLILAPALLGHALSELEAVIVAALALLIAVLSFVLIERPIRRMQLIVRRPALGLAGGAAVVAASVLVIAFFGPILAPLRPSGAVAALAPLRASRDLAAPALPPSSRAVPARAFGRGPDMTASALEADLRAGVNTRTLPANLNPPLTRAAHAKPLIVLNGCSLQDPGVRNRPCVYGDTKSHSTVVLFGDSHATTWFPALEAISNEYHWRLVDLTKAACPPAEVAVWRDGGWYPNCIVWRRNTERAIAAMHPALVVVAWSRFYSASARPLPGVPTGFGSTWLNGTAATFRLLHRSADHVVFISDVPVFHQSVPVCLSAHMSDVHKCTIARTAAVYDPQAKAGELKLARRFQIVAIDPTPWFCTPTRCPGIVGNILLYRDEQHMTPAWSRFLAPVLADAIVPMIQSQPASNAAG